MSTSALPPPSFSSSTPVYSSEPTRGEQRLHYRPRIGALNASNPEGIYINKWDDVTLILNNQEKNSTRPVFGRQGMVSGTVLLDAREVISEVSVKLVGTMKFSHSYEDFEYTLFEEKHSLYSFSETTSPTTSLPFSFSFPTYFEFKDRVWPIPPSLEVTLPGQSPQQYVNCKYTFCILVGKMLHRRTPFLGTSRTLTVDVQYYPRMLPPRPIVGLNGPFLSLIKACPEEWREFIYTVPPESSTQSTISITCQLYLPSVGIFGIRDAIPFFLQVEGTPQSLRQLKAQITSLPHGEMPPIRIYLLRQVTMLLASGVKLPRQPFHIGQSSLHPVPPSWSSVGDEILNWEGSLVCDENLLVGSFDAGRLAVNDYITLDINLPGGLKPLRHGHHVQLVTDTWDENP